MARPKSKHFITFGPEIPLVPLSQFSKMPLTEDQWNKLWTLCGPSVERNMLRLEMWQVICSAYLEGLEHGMGLEREKHGRTTEE